MAKLSNCLGGLILSGRISSGYKASVLLFFLTLFLSFVNDAFALRRPGNTAPPKAWLGISFADIPQSEIPAIYAHTGKEGAVRVQDVFSGTSADQAGIKPGDYILAVNGAPLSGRKTLLDSIGSKQVGDVVEVRLGREGKILTQKMALSPRPEDMAAITQLLIGSVAPPLQGDYYHLPVGTLETNRGKVVVLDFWATWCGPCRVTIPYLNSLYDKFRDEGVQIIGISSESREELQSFREASKQTYPLFRDVSGLTTRAFRAYAYPTLVFIDRAGVVQRVEVGAHNSAQLEKWIRELL